MAQPSFPYLNRKIKCSFPWYRNYSEVTRNTIQCAKESEGCVPFKQWTPRTNLPPFQIFATEASQYGLATPQTWGIYDLDGNLVVDLAADLDLIQVVQFNDPAREYLVYTGSALAVPLPDGTYESRISIESGRVFYSETFQVICVDDATSCFLRLKWTSCGNVGTIYYQDGFQNVLYLDPDTFVLRPSPELKLDNDEGGKGQQNTTFVRKEVTYNLDLGLIPWYLLDALTEIPLVDTVTLQSATGTDPIHDVDISYAWSPDNTCLALTSIAFKLDDADANGSCCETWDPPCLVPCQTISGFRGTEDPVVGEFYVETGEDSYREYLGPEGTPPMTEDFYGGAVACDSGLVTGTGGFPDSYFDGSSWQPVAQMSVTPNGDDIDVTAVIMPRYFGQLQYSTDGGTTWINGAGPFDADEWAAGVTTTIPTAALIRIAIAIGECTIGISNIDQICAGDGVISITVDTDATIELDSDTLYFTAYKQGGSLSVYAMSSYPTISSGTYCIWSSNSDGEIGGTGAVFYLAGDGTGTGIVDVTNVPNIHAVSLEAMSLSSIDVSHNHLLQQFSLQTITSITNVDLANNMQLSYVSIDYVPSLTSILVSSLDLCATINITSCALDQTTVDNILIAAAASGLPVNIDLSGGTSSGPSGTGLSAKSTVISNGGTVTTN